MVNPILQEQQDKARGQSKSCRDEELDPHFASFFAGLAPVRLCAPRTVRTAHSDPPGMESTETSPLAPARL